MSDLKIDPKMEEYFRAHLRQDISTHIFQVSLTFDNKIHLSITPVPPEVRKMAERDVAQLRAQGRTPNFLPFVDNADLSPPKPGEDNPTVNIRIGDHKNGWHGKVESKLDSLGLGQEIERPMMDDVQYPKITKKDDDDEGYKSPTASFLE